MVDGEATAGVWPTSPSSGYMTGEVMELDGGAQASAPPDLR
jgi:hypothetical protein